MFTTSAGIFTFQPKEKVVDEYWLVESITGVDSAFRNKDDALHYSIQTWGAKVTWVCGNHSCTKCLGDKAFSGDAGVIECSCKD